MTRPGGWLGGRETGRHLTGSLNFTETSMRSAAPGILIASGIVQYLGASIAVTLFAAATVGAVAWGRMAVAAVVMMVWRRPKNLVRSGRRAIGMAAVYGLVLVTMNVLFYQAIARIPLGTAVALEFLGPVILAAVTGRGWRIWSGIVLAISGVFMISWVGVDVGVPGVGAGIGFAIAAGGAWAVYMWLGSKVAQTGAGPDSLALGMAIGALGYVWLAIPGFWVILTDARLLAAMVAVGVFSSVVPYVLEVMILTKIPAGTFALLNALYPATSLIVGMIVLRQIPTMGELAGLVLITVAVMLVTWPRPRKGAAPRIRC
ncbi:DMT family transporter [Trueperella pyogenes]|uniref:EamA family transporter n=1 Tax=Trueperella pyogenes TaxID=1661 RepID=UPI003255BC15